MNEIFTIAGIAVIAAGFAVILNQYKPEYSFAVVLGFGILILLYVFPVIEDIAKHVTDFSEYSGINREKYGILLRCLGICTVTKIASETCKDCGQSSISSKVELAGKIIMLTAAMPLYSEILDIIKKLIEL